MRSTIFTITTILALLTSCSQADGGSNNFAIEAKLTDYKSDTIITLYEREFSSIQIDTVVAKKGIFNIQGYAPEHQPLYIKDSRGNLITTVIANKGLKISITGEVEGVNLTVTGDSINEKLAEFQRDNHQIIANLKRLQSSYTQNQTDTSFQKELQAAEIKVVSAATNFVNSNRDNLASVYVIYLYVANGDKSKEVTLNLLSNLTSGIKDGIITARIEQYTTKPRYHVGRVMPYTQMTDIKDSVVFSFQRYNKPTVVLFWQPNDSLSMEALEITDKLSREYKPGDLTIHNIGVTPNKTDWKSVVKSLKNRTINSLIAEGWNSPPIRNLQINYLPSFMFITQTNTILGRELTLDSLKTLIDIEVEKNQKRNKR